MELKTVCKNPWCKATFIYKEEDMILSEKKSINSEEIEKFPPTMCYKCKSLSSELSGGVEWKTKEFEGDRYDGMPHQIKYKVTNFRL